MPRFSAVIFDFDYTLADSSQGVLECVNHALGRLGLPAASPEDIKKTIGMSLPATLVVLAGKEHKDKGDDFHHLFIERADKVMADMTTVFEDVPRVIRLLRDEGVPLGIVSTKFRYRIETILGRAGLLEHFDVIVGGEDVSRHKPDPEGIQMAIERLGENQSTLYVGDSLSDAEAAMRAGVPFVAVLSGVTPREAFSKYSAYRIIEKIVELVDLL
ncbi:MAG: HAD-IA family hydrolase [Candidatus Bathyarchaeota archaeon]|nr:HAD-IA family hydrolase [Candidatus Bathyarchaeota archaeon]